MKTTILILLTLGLQMNGRTQSFVNLSFESAAQANLGTNPAVVATTTALLGWSAYINGIAQPNIFYNSVPLSAAEVTLQGPGNGLYPPIQGQYFVSLWGEYRPLGGPGDSAAIGQTGQIPGTAQSLVIWGVIGGAQITFNGQLLGFQLTGTAANYSIYAADISAYAGQTGELRFTAPLNQSGINIDNIQFSNIPIPEPSALSVFGLGLLALGWHWRRKGQS